MASRYAHRRADGLWDVYASDGEIVRRGATERGASALLNFRRAGGWPSTEEQREAARRRRVGGSLSDGELMLRAIRGR